MNLPENNIYASYYQELNVNNPDFDDRTLGQQIARHAEERGDSIAMILGEASINYRQYEQYANRLANGLAALGVKKGDVVGVHLPNIPQYPLAIAAISKLGCIGTGVSPLLTPAEVAFQVQDAGVKVLITLEQFTGVIGGMDCVPDCLIAMVSCSMEDFIPGAEISPPVIQGMQCLSFKHLVLAHSDHHEQVPVHWNDTFMIQYTGGTTGKPKGAELTHRNLMHNPAQYSAADPWAEGEEVIACAFPMFHVAGLTLILFSARSGGAMMLVPDPRDTESFCRLMQAFPPTSLGAVPALYDMLLNTPQFHDIDFSRLRIAYTGAAPLTSATFKALCEVVGKNKVSDMFGMTETSPCYVQNPTRRYREGAVGIPVPGSLIRIADEQDPNIEKAQGQSGEILATGPQVMKGYWNLPNETANSLREIDGRLWMRTGDVGYLDEEGYLHLCDRAKDMLIVGGYKVFSVEIEDKLQSLPEVAVSAVIGRPDPKRGGNDIVHLYVQLTPDARSGGLPEDLAERIRTYCSENLAPYKVPRHIHFIDEIPLTAVGKIDKKALRG